MKKIVQIIIIYLLTSNLLYPQMLPVSNNALFSENKDVSFSENNDVCIFANIV